MTANTFNIMLTIKCILASQTSPSNTIFLYPTADLIDTWISNKQLKFHRPQPDIQTPASASKFCCSLGLPTLYMAILLF